jgi:hypothetical protein
MREKQTHEERKGEKKYRNRKRRTKEVEKRDKDKEKLTQEFQKTFFFFFATLRSCILRSWSYTRVYPKVSGLSR